MKGKLLLSVIAASLLFVSCSKEEPVVKGGGDSQKLEGFKISEKPINLTIHGHYDNSYAYDENWSTAKEAARMTNIYLKGTASNMSSDSRESFNLMMVSGNIPDIVSGNLGIADELVKYGMQGAFVPLNQLIEEHAPNLNKFFQENEDIKKVITAPDGNIYHIPYLMDSRVARGYFIRKDWLDNVGLEHPDNIDELYTVLKAFRDKDPNNTGVDDTVPLFFRNWQETIRLATLWGARTAGTDSYLSFYKDENNKVRHGWGEPKFKEGIKNVTKWYQEGLIDREVFTRKSQTREIMLSNNIGGMTRDWIPSTATYNNMLEDKIPGFRFEPMLPPVNIDGIRFEENRRSTVKPDGWSISIVNKYPVETIKYFDFFFSEEGRRLANFGVEGVHYDIVDGKPQFKDHMLNSLRPTNMLLRDDGAQIPIGYQLDTEYERQWFNSFSLEATEMYEEKAIYPDEFILPTMTEEDRKVYDTYWPTLQAYMEETVQIWIVQGADIDKEWDTYINELNRLGLAKVTKAIQNSVDRR